MCGIAGIFAYHYAACATRRSELETIRDNMAVRGPDHAGSWYSSSDRVALGHRRLSIIDVTARANQPMVSADQRLVITFAGEIYNFRALRAKLDDKGHVFRTQSDTEVILALYAEKGPALVEDLRGMFSFGLWDQERGGLLLARDPYGIKPLYYADDGWTFRFASQVKALRAGNAVSSDPDPAGIVGFYLFGSVPEPYTTVRQIRSLPAGSTLWVDSTGPRIPSRYFSVAEAFSRPKPMRPPRLHNSQQAQEQLRDALLESVRYHLVADVPVGAFLSAGIDSGSLVGLMRDAGLTDIQTVTLKFDEFREQKDDEAPLAEAVARRYGTKHTTRLVTEQEFRADLPKILEAMDQPSIDGINTWFVSKAAKELGLKVAISGLGGDELFGGYPSFRDVPRWAGRFLLASRIPFLGEFARLSLSLLSRRSRAISPKAAAFLKYAGSYEGAYLLRRGLFLPGELNSLLPHDLLKEGLRRLRPLRHIRSVLDPMPPLAFGRVAALESSLYMRNQLLRDTDWASMAHSIEVRVPLVDATLLQQLAPLLPMDGELGAKHVLARSPQLPLPEAVIARRKTGFSTPVAQWLEHNTAAVFATRHVRMLPARSHWSRRWAVAVAPV